MAIILKCSKCQVQLEVDDAFAGGVCRCVHCGSLSQVPLQPTMLDRKGRPATPPETAKPAAPIVDDVQQTIRIAPTRRYSGQKTLGLAGVAVTIVALAMIATVIWIFVKQMQNSNQPGKSQPTPTPQSAGPTPPAEQIAPEAGHKLLQPDTFLGLPLSGKVAFLVEAHELNSIYRARLAIGESVKLAKPQLEYIVIPWKATGEASGTQVSFPADGLAKAADKAAKLADWADHIETRDVADPSTAAKKAVARNATMLVLITENDPEKETIDLLKRESDAKHLPWLAAVIVPAGYPVEAKDYKELLRLTGKETSIAPIPQGKLDDELQSGGAQ